MCNSTLSLSPQPPTLFAEKCWRKRPLASQPAYPRLPSTLLASGRIDNDIDKGPSMRLRSGMQLVHAPSPCPGHDRVKSECRPLFSWSAPGIALTEGLCVLALDTEAPRPARGQSGLLSLHHCALSSSPIRSSPGYRRQSEAIALAADSNREHEARPHYMHLQASKQA